MSTPLPSLSDAEAFIGTFLSSGKLGQVGAGAAAADAAGNLQTELLAAVNKAGAFLGPILGNAGTSAFVAGASTSADSSAARVQKSLLGGWTLGQIGGIAAVVLLGGFLLWKPRR